MKKMAFVGVAISMLFTGSAWAADLPLNAPPASPPPAWSWTGFYIGIQGGAGWGVVDDSITAVQVCGTSCGPLFALNPPGVLRDTVNLSGGFVGATAGFNWQWDRVVLGIEGD